MNRREFLLSTAAVASVRSASLSGERVGPKTDTTDDGRSAWRDDFPIASVSPYLNSAAIHPMGAPAARALQQYIGTRLNGSGRDFDGDAQIDLKRRFAQLIGAKGPEEIA